MAAARKKHIRNIREIPASIRFGESKKRVDLKPRGQRGDIASLAKVDFEDPLYDANLNLLFEEISAAEAKKILENQVVNIAENQPNPLLRFMKNSEGEPYGDDAIVVGEEAQEKGVVVAPLDEQGNLTIDRYEGITRTTPEEQPVWDTDSSDADARNVNMQTTNAPGSAGYQFPNIPDSIPPEDHAAYVAAQRVEEQGAAGLTLKLEKTQTVKSSEPTRKPKSK